MTSGSTVRYAGSDGRCGQSTSQVFWDDHKMVPSGFLAWLEQRHNVAWDLILGFAGQVHPLGLHDAVLGQISMFVPVVELA